MKNIRTRYYLLRRVSDESASQVLGEMRRRYGPLVTVRLSRIDSDLVVLRHRANGEDLENFKKDLRTFTSLVSLVSSGTISGLLRNAERLGIHLVNQRLTKKEKTLRKKHLRETHGAPKTQGRFLEK